MGCTVGSWMIGIEGTGIVVDGNDTTGTVWANDVSRGIAPRGVRLPRPELEEPEMASVGTGPVEWVTDTAGWSTYNKMRKGGCGYTGCGLWVLLAKFTAM